MSYTLPQKLQKLVPYAPLTGEYSIRLDANESFLSPPEWLLDKLIQAVRQVAFNRYPDPYCVALCERFAAFFGIAPSLVVAGNGSDELIGLIVASFLQPGETMVTVKPDFSMYAFYAQMAGAQVAVFEKTALALDAKSLLVFAKERSARLLILSNPCNPTSLVASQREILQLVEGLPDCLVVIDEAYMDFSEGSILQKAADYSNLIVLKTCSKAFGMAAIRLGFAVAHPTLAIALKAAKSPYNVNSMTQAVGCVLLEQRQYLLDCIEQLKASRDQLCKRLQALAVHKTDLLEVVQTCANFVFVQVQSPEEVCTKAAERGVALRCMPPFLRISAGSPAENQAVCQLLEEILN